MTMKNLLYTLTLATLIFSCSSQPKTDTTAEIKIDEKKASCTYALISGGNASVNWTAFKFTEKVAVGGTFCTPGPFGAGKTVLQHLLSRHAEVDIVIVAACGEQRW